ncbi:hypothetical protein K1719_006289 [Acacia pycnantha]|nr:hypothetical protein K1719_006289 [Acacia pycnantha]
METNLHRHPQLPSDFFNKSPPSSAPNLTVSTELSLSSSFSSFTKTRTSKHTPQYFSTSRKTKPPKPSNSNTSGCSTTLNLYDDPWKIKKFLTASDLGELNRLLLSSEDSTEDLVDTLVLRNNNNNSNSNDNEEKVFIMGREVSVRYRYQVDAPADSKATGFLQDLVLIGDWNQDFVKRRSLNKGDEIGLQWDPNNFCFNFSVLKRSLLQ